MSEHERRLLLTGTLDTSGVGGSPYESLHNVAVAFGAPVAEAVEPEPVPEPEPEPEKVAETDPSVAEQAPEEKAPPRKRAAKKTQASAPAEK
ncbi:hypothetical protein [Streptomyces sp. MH60]|uniref:hypothetical protein n=1 Tax=Streptomyces sp. MH60 TaxID=1940758 RepID=UPI000D4DACD6|nr:hypothetical protein [Streptomyces sp. MH60]PPS89461.1 hypothetical protein BZZ08_01607 [Streptomyces sp. MH60]